MLQPFIPFQRIYLDRLISLHKIYLVSQSYFRHYDHFNENNRPGILLSDYDDLGQANLHLNAIKSKGDVAEDKFAALLDITRSAHYNKIIEMLEGDQYALYWAVTADAEALKRRLDKKYKDSIREWIAKNTNWNIGGSDKVTSQLEVRFGELFLLLKWRKFEMSFKLSEIEGKSS